MNFLLISFGEASIDWSDVTAIILSAVTAYLAYQQVKVAEMQRKDDLYDKRYAVYEKLCKLRKSIVDDRQNVSQQKELLIEAMSQKFLFNEDVNSFMEEILERHRLEIALVFSGYANFVDGRMSYCKNCPDEIWTNYDEAYKYFLTTFPSELLKKFEPYLKLEKKSVRLHVLIVRFFKNLKSRINKKS